MTRTVAIRMHQPAIVFLMLVLVMFACSVMVGYSLAANDRRSWAHVICFAAVLTIAFYVILDLEYPRFGLIRIDWMDQVLRDVRQSMR
jgi:Na+-driven multidrug efflux pump